MVKKLLLAVAGLSISLLAGELFLRVLGINYAAVPMMPDPVLHHVHQKNIRFINFNRKNEFHPHPMYFDPAGRVNNPQSTIEWNPTAATRIILMGDSFVEGAQVPFEQSFYGILASRCPPDATILNAGVGSYSPVLERLQWKHELASLNPTHVVLMLYMNDIGNDAQYAAKAGVHSQVLPDAVPGPRLRWYTPVWHRSYLCRLIRRCQESIIPGRKRMFNAVVEGEYALESPDISSLTASALLALKMEINKGHCEFVLTAVPSKKRHFNPKATWAEPEFADKVKRWADENKIAYIDLADRFRKADPTIPLFFQRDIHFTAAGHAIIAETLAEYLPGWKSADRPLFLDKQM